MSDVNDAASGEFEAANSRLNQGLKSCRSVVDNYKSLLSSEENMLAETAQLDGPQGLIVPPPGD